MSSGFVYYGVVDIVDAEYFTKDRLKEWEQLLIDAYEKILAQFKEKIDNVSPLSFFIDDALLDEVLVDAVIGMKKIVVSENNTVHAPNSFKVAAYLAYWWLRHKPVSVHYPSDFSLCNVQLKHQDDMPEKAEAEDHRNQLIWQLKHVNELVAVEFVCTYLFDFERVVCGKIACENVKSKNKGNFCFENFDVMNDQVLKKLLYYFSYRAVAPKILESILESLTYHPAWGLTGKHWNTQEALPCA